MLRTLCGLALVLRCKTEPAVSCDGTDYVSILETNPVEEVVQIKAEKAVVADVEQTQYVFTTTSGSMTVSRSSAISLPFVRGTNVLFARTEEVEQHLQQCLKILQKKPPDNEKSKKFWDGLIAVSKNTLDGFLGMISYQQKLMGSITNMIVGSNNFAMLSDKGMSFPSAFALFESGLNEFVERAEKFDSNAHIFVKSLQSQIGILFQNQIGDAVVQAAQHSHAAKVEDLQNKKAALAQAEAKYGLARQAAIAQERSKADELKMYEDVLSQTQKGHQNAAEAADRVAKESEAARAREVQAQEEVRAETTRHRFWIFSWSTTTVDNSAAERAARRRALAENFEHQAKANQMDLEGRIKALNEIIADLRTQHGAAVSALKLAETEYETNVMQRAAREYSTSLAELDRAEELLEKACASTGQGSENLVSFLKEAHAITKGAIATAVVTTGIAGSITEITGALKTQFSTEKKWDDVTPTLGQLLPILDGRGYKQRSDCDLTPDLVASEVQEIEKDYGKALTGLQKNKLQKFLSGSAFSLPDSDLVLMRKLQSDIIREFAGVLKIQSDEVHKRLDQSSSRISRLPAP